MVILSQKRLSRIGCVAILAASVSCAKVDDISRSGSSPSTSNPVSKPIRLSLSNTPIASSSGTPTVTVTGVQAGDTVTLYSDSNCTSAVGSGTATGTSVDITSSGLSSDGTYQLYANRTNALGTSDCSTGYAQYFKDSSVSNVSVTQQSKVVNEGAGSTTVTVQISSPKPYPVTVNYNLAGTTVSSSLHDLTPSSLVIPANATTANITFNVLDDALALGSKNLVVNLASTNLTTVAIGTNSSSSVIIKDNEGAATTYGAIDTGYSKGTCGLTSGGTMKCWGLLGGLNIATPTAFDAGTVYTKISTGAAHACGITSTNVLKCWGSENYGELGDGGAAPQASPIVADAGTLYSEVWAGQNNTCGITTAGVLKCFGLNTSAALGDGSTTNRTSPTVIDAGTTYSKVSVDATQGCGITTAGVLKCWGNSGRVGDGTSNPALSPIVIDGGTTYSAVSVGLTTNCAITTAGVLKCWGIYVGDGTNSSRLAPTIIDSGVSYSQVSAGNSNSCALTTSGVLKCWGQTNFGNTFLSPTVFDPGVSYSSISSKAWHTCGVTTTSLTKCWGLNSNGQLGNGTSDDYRSASGLLDSSTTYSKIFEAEYNSCAIATSGELRCWGSGTSGVNGDGSTSTRYIPATVDPGTTYSKVSLYRNEACGITTASKLKCWGSANLGTGAATSYFASAVDPSTNYIDVAVSSFSACGITSANVLNCWSGVSTPSVFDSGVSYSKLSSGDGHICGITTTGVLKCWGTQNFSGQIGDGSTTPRAAPVVIDSGTTYSSISSTYRDNCAITTAGALKCWGENFNQQFDMSSTNYLSPAVIDGGTTYSSVSVGKYNICGFTTGGVLKCRGSISMFGMTTPDAGYSYSQMAAGLWDLTGITTTGALRIYYQPGFTFNMGQIFLVDQ